MIFFKKMIFLSVCALFATVVFTGSAQAQARDRVVKTTSSQPTNLPSAVSPTATIKATSSSRPVLTNDIRVVKADAAWEPLVEKTASVSRASVAAMAAAGRTIYDAATSVRIDNAIKSRYGLRYVYATAGPYTYDCSGFVWSAFLEAGINNTRTSARNLWAQSAPVSDEERFKFGTLVFLNGLGHVGIVADENGFYHASSSKGITYSPFKGYWGKRIVGFRKLYPEAVTARK